MLDLNTGQFAMLVAMESIGQQLKVIINYRCTQDINEVRRGSLRLRGEGETHDSETKLSYLIPPYPSWVYLGVYSDINIYISEELNQCGVWKDLEENND